MEADSEGEIQNKKAVKPKRQMKTPFQLETLEKAYALEAYPSEATRADLSEKLGLTDRQLQMWFCHRRLKDKKETPGKNSNKGKPISKPESPVEELRQMEYEAGSDYGSGSGSGSSPMMEQKKEVSDDVPTKRRYYESSPQSIMELRAIACVEAQLGQPLREDGPILGMEFDPLPPGAFGAPIEPALEQRKRLRYPYDVRAYEQSDVKPSKASARSPYEYWLPQDQPSTRSDSYGQVSRSPYSDVPIENTHGRNSTFAYGDGFRGRLSRGGLFTQEDKKGNVFSSPQRDEGGVKIQESFRSSRVNVPSTAQQISVPENRDVSFDAQIFRNGADIQVERKYKTDETRLAREVEAQENRIRRELEKEDILRRKSEERMRKEMERYERERRKEEERLMRERQREEERSLREQRRELERREKFLRKEYLKAEKIRQKEELRREKEELRRKAAMEKANARKIAKESMDLIEDEQLELMEIAAAKKGIPSIVQLDYDTLQNLEAFRDSLIVFPPKSVQLKRPFAFQPWMDSEENIGNLLMVWRFCITFADVLGLWPFTLYEFVQAFHDYDSRLLSEIHVSLLKLIIKDIEDVARTPTGLGTNQYTIANTEGGHPQLVEGAYLWGFDIRDWQQNLNPLTWPEIFRQLALAAGFGPRLKRSATWTSLSNNDEVKGSEDLISTLRNGVAAENAFALMREKGLLLPRRSRNRLTPGTVKFAAYYVLSLEGSSGLTLVELANKIKKSGLRDLTTSKTPEASISVALNRDLKLFERVAPSTYCVRSPFRNDPADAEAILSEARNKIRQFENGFLGAEDVDDVERDEESDGDVDVDEDPEVDDLTAPLSCLISGKDNACNDTPIVKQNETGKELSASTVSGTKDTKPPSRIEQYVTSVDIEPRNADKEKFEIDESKPGALWIQGLTEGEYSLLSVDERLKALVALVGIANEGNSIRVALEDRLEAANALKKQMWVEAQLDRSHLKEDIISKLDFPSCAGVKAETQVGSSPVDGSQSPLRTVETKTEEANKDEREDGGSAVESRKISSDVVNCGTKEECQNGTEGLKPQGVPESKLNNVDGCPNSKSLVDSFTTPDNYSVQQQGYTSKRSRSQLKAYIGHMAEEMYIYRSLPLGHDRRRNRYWQFVASASKDDPCAGRIFVELHDGKWRVIDSEEDFDALISSLDARGIRESHLRLMLQKIEASFKENVSRTNRNIVPKGESTVEEAADRDSSPNCSASTNSPGSVVFHSNFDTTDKFSWFRIELGRDEKEKFGSLKRYQDFQKWRWKACFNSQTLRALKCSKRRCTSLLATCDSCLDSYPFEDIHCNACYNTSHMASKNLDGKDENADDYSLPLGIKLLKALLALVEVSIPVEALKSFWNGNFRTTWGIKLKKLSSIEELLQVLAVLENAIKHDFLSSNFETIEELLGFSFPSEASDNDLSVLESVPLLPWLPKTASAAALRLFELDASIVYVKQDKAEPCEDKTVKVHMKLASGCSPQKNKEVELKKQKQQDYLKEDNFPDPQGRGSSHKRGRSSHDQQNGRKLQRRVPGFKSDTGRQRARIVDKSYQGQKQQGKRTNLQGSLRGLRTVRKRRTEKVSGKEKLLGHLNKIVCTNSYGGSARNLAEEEWGLEQVRMDVDSPESGNSGDAAESEDNEAEKQDLGTLEQDFYGSSRGWNENPMELIDDAGDAAAYDNGMEEVRDEDSDGEVEISYDSNDEANRVRKDNDTDPSLSSDDYSD